MKHFDDGVDSVSVGSAAKRLAQIAPGDSPEWILDALRGCVGAEAGLLMVVKPGPPSHVTHHVLRMPSRLFEGWVHTQPDYMERAFNPALRAQPGDFWNHRDGLSSEVRNGLEVLHTLDPFGFGEGAGLKLLRRTIPGMGEEHVVMALLTERGRFFPKQASAVCRALAQPLQQAVFRLDLPFTVGQSIHAQLHETDDVGLVCLGADGAVVELNQRAHTLVQKYRDMWRTGPARFMMDDFVQQAQRHTLGGRTWQLVHPSRTSVMQVRMHVMPKERFTLSRDLPIIKMDEWSWSRFPDPRVLEEPSIFHCLTKREREIAMMLLTSGLAPQEIAHELEIKPRTVYKHVERVHKKLNVRSFGELVALVRASRN